MSHDQEGIELCPPTWAFVLTVLVPQLYREDRPEAALTLLEDAAQKLDYAVKQQRDQKPKE